MSRGPHPSARPEGRRATRAAVPAGVAPGLDPVWADAFLLELRLADVPGRHIGAALAEVASHCADSGETAAEAFGDPVEYARSLELPADAAAAADADGARAAVASAVPWTVQTAGLLLLAAGAPAVATEVPVAVTTGHLAALVLLVAALAALARWGGAALRVVVRRPVVAWLAGTVFLGLLVVAFLLLDGVLARVPGPGAVAAGAVAMLVGTLAVVRVLRRDVVVDPVTAPLAPTAPRGGAGNWVLRYGPALMAPVGAVLLVAAGLTLG